MCGVLGIFGLPSTTLGLKKWKLTNPSSPAVAISTGANDDDGGDDGGDDGVVSSINVTVVLYTEHENSRVSSIDGDVLKVGADT